MLFETSKGAVPASAFFNPNSIQLVGGKGADNFPQGRHYTESFYKKYRGNRKTSTFVDVDDKNCLAQLTVAMKLNHGVRQWLYIIVGVLGPLSPKGGT
jgi:hypothetical protein